MTYRSVAELMLALREFDLLSQHELAKRGGVTQAQLCRYEKGVKEPSLATLRRMVGALGWALTFGLEPSTAEIDKRLDEPFDVMDLLGFDVGALLEIAAAAIEGGADLVVGGAGAGQQDYRVRWA